MKIIKKFLSDLKSTFETNSNLSTYTGVQATGEFLKLAFTPFCLTMIFGTIMLISTGKWNDVFLGAIKEFLQVTGVKLLIYIVTGVFAVSLIFYKVSWINRVCSYLVNPLVHITFSFIAVINGVLWGLVIAACIEARSFDPFFLTVVLSVLSILVAIGCYYSSRFFGNSVRDGINNLIGQKTPRVMLFFGIVLMVITIKGLFFDEQWKELASGSKCVHETTTQSK